MSCMSFWFILVQITAVCSFCGQKDVSERTACHTEMKGCIVHLLNILVQKLLNVWWMVKTFECCVVAEED